MFTNAKTIYEQVLDDLPLGSGNTVENIDNYDKAFFLRILSDHIISEFYNPARCTVRELKFLHQMVNAFLAQAMQCAGCVEHAASVFVKSLELNVPECKELIQIEGRHILKDVLVGYNADG